MHLTPRLPSASPTVTSLPGSCILCLLTDRPDIDRKMDTRGEQDSASPRTASRRVRSTAALSRPRRVVAVRWQVAVLNGLYQRAGENATKGDVESVAKETGLCVCLHSSESSPDLPKSVHLVQSRDLDQKVDPETAQVQGQEVCKSHTSFVRRCGWFYASHDSFGDCFFRLSGKLRCRGGVFNVNPDRSSRKRRHLSVQQ